MDFWATIDFDSDGKPESRFSDMLTHLTGSKQEDLPSFLSDIPLCMNTMDDEVGLGIIADEASKCIIFIVFVQLGELRVQHIQFKYAADAEGTQLLKRVFLTSIDALQTPTVPLVGNLPQQFDEAFCMWCSR